MEQDDQLNPTSTNTVRRAYRGIEGLNRAADEVEAVMAMPGWAIVMELVEAQKASIDRKLRGGSVPHDQATYAMWHGRLDGMATVQDLAAALIARRADEMAKQQAKHEGPGAVAPEPVRS